MNKMFALMLKNPPEGVPTYVIMGECGYPYVTTYFDSRTCRATSKRVKEDLDCYTQFGMWSPNEGFTLDNVQIVEIILKFNGQT